MCFFLFHRKTVSCQESIIINRQTTSVVCWCPTPSKATPCSRGTDIIHGTTTPTSYGRIIYRPAVRLDTHFNTLIVVLWWQCEKQIFFCKKSSPVGDSPYYETGSCEVVSDGLMYNQSSRFVRRHGGNHNECHKWCDVTMEIIKEWQLLPSILRSILASYYRKEIGYTFNQNCWSRYLWFIGTHVFPSV